MKARPCKRGKVRVLMFAKERKPMRYLLLYLRKSFRLQAKRHLTLAFVLTCAFILPLLISIYRDSSAYGKKQQLLDLTKGETFQIANASEDDLPFFEGIDGLSVPRYEDGVITLHILSEEEWKKQENVNQYGFFILDRIEQSGKPSLIATAFDYDSAHGIAADSSGSEQTTLLLVNFLLIVLSSFLVGSAYQSHIKRFSADMGALRSLGAENRQICAIFLVEFAVTFVFSAAVALLLTSAVMKLLFRFYLEVRKGQGISWLIFRIDPENTALHLAVFFAVLLLVVLRTLAKACRASAVAMGRDDFQVSEAPKKLRKRQEKGGPVRSLLALWLQRTNKIHRSCLLVAVPVMTVFLFLFGYLSLNADYISASPDYAFRITKAGVSLSALGGFTKEDLAYLSGLSQVAEVNCRREAPEEFFKQTEDGLLIDVVELRLTSPELHRETEALLRQRFSGMEYEIYNGQAVAEQGQEASKGVYPMLAFLFSAMFALVLVIVSVKLCDYIEDSRKTITTLSTLGATNGAITASYLWQSALSAMLTLALSMGLSVVLVALASFSTTQKPTFDGPLGLAYLTVGVLTGCAFLLPVSQSLHAILKKRKRSGI